MLKKNKQKDRKSEFPKVSMNKTKLFLKLWKIRSKLKKRKPENFFGWLYSQPHPVAVKAYKFLLEQNPSNLGTWFGNTVDPDSTQGLEHDVLSFMCDLYYIDTGKAKGYITSGSTESNIFLTWLGRSKLQEKIPSKKICLLSNDLSHYSINKSASVVGVDAFNSSLDSTNWNMSVAGLKKTITERYRRGYRGFMIPITLGYTVTGTNDDIDALVKLTKEIGKSYKDIGFYLWIDAALNGLTIPFKDHSFSPLRHTEISGVCVDFHKFGMTPYPTGIVLYRKGLHTLIKRPIDYLPQEDATLLGSRPGASAASIWSMIKYLGSAGYQKKLMKCLSNKNHFIDQLTKFDPKVKIITDKDSVTLAVAFSRNIKISTKTKQRYGLMSSERKYNFHLQKVKKFKLYKFYFLPHISKEVIDSFFQDIKI